MTFVAKERGTRSDVRQTKLGWQRLVAVSAVLATVTTAGVAIYLSDIEGGVIAVGFGVCTGLFRWRLRQIGVFGLILVSAITFLFMLAAAITNSRGWAGFEGMLIAAGLGAISGLVLVACIGWLIKRGTPSNGPSIAVAVSVVAFVVPLIVTALIDPPESGAADFDLVAEDVAFSESVITASPGTVSIGLENRDLFWHTFTIEELGVDLRVPVSAEMTGRTVCRHRANDGSPQLSVLSFDVLCNKHGPSSHSTQERVV